MLLFSSLLILHISINVQANKIRRFNVRKDLTEHCRKGVPLSVFLGTHVTEASSQVLQFGKTVFPYSCYIAARTEAGNNIILVMQDMQDDQLQLACRDNAKQIIVYEIQDTYGGYWGEMPDFVRNSALPTNVYTLGTTPTATETETEPEESSETEETTTEAETPSSTKQKVQDTIAIEIPIVNISGQFLDPLKSFKDIFGVKSTHGRQSTSFLQYLTTIYPLVQFSEERGKPSRLAIEYDINPFEQSLQHMTSKTNRRPTHFWHLFRKTTRFKFSKFSTITVSQTPGYSSNDVKARLYKITTKQMRTKTRFYSSKHTIDFPTSLKSVNITRPNINDMDTTTIKDAGYLGAHLSTVAKTGYLLQNHSIPIAKSEYQASTVTESSYNNSKIITHRTKIDVNYNSLNTSERAHNMITTINMNEYELDTVLDDNDKDARRIVNFGEANNAGNKEKLVSVITPNSRDSTTPLTMVIKIPDIDISESNTSVTPSVMLADRETWENLVLAAPKMASVLNKSAIIEHEILLDLDPSLQGVTLLDKLKRDKRYLQGISVENMMPRQVTSEISLDMSKTEGFNYLEFNVEEFGKNVERINEQAQSRVALRYPHRYLGKELFNLCDHKDLQTRHIIMFNSSRIWIKISNFSMESVSIVLTEARKVLGTDAFCEADYLECQLTGTRVCIDALNACDGVPNCGAYDIYDEDRLRCGYTPGMQQSVCIAAFAFLVLAHTIIYIIMYWLKRCVPKVSKAFFIYSEGAENMLNLQSVMRSPHFEDVSVSDTSISDHTLEEILPSLQNKKVSVYQILRNSFKALWGGKVNKEAPSNKKEEDRQFRCRFFTHDFFSVGKSYEDTAVQTAINMHTLSVSKTDTVAEELKVLKFCRDSKNSSCKCKEIEMQTEQKLPRDVRQEPISQPRTSFDKPKERLTSPAKAYKHESPVSSPSRRKKETDRMQRTVGNLDTQESKTSILVTTSAEIHPHSDKKLRFDEFAITIKNSMEEGGHRFGTEKLDQNLDKIEVVEETGPIKQPKTFWLGKKKKKPTGPSSSQAPRHRPNNKNSH